ncbi:uncharacterized protein B0H18DRAFT_983894 [Fomitopsis serialis]|uniref:uncharacterized protein n=1 Tax=Fomitopsis serialis TaxID=139415 RepID=UPI0020082A44|nr:uncharacterized protein B0H18DRAFT_983894 [Neoantrodia serialis]KAH9933474.1 hypothetical protein B0H18DRAFT_983894 [Neoantrodia serialis]
MQTMQRDYESGVHWGTIWRTGRLRVHGESYSFHSPGIDGMEVEATANSLLMTLFTIAPRHMVNASAPGKRLHTIIELARNLPVTDPLLQFNSHTAAIVHLISHLHDLMVQYTPVSMGLRFRRLKGVGLSGEQERILDKPLKNIIDELRAQSPYGYVPRHANDVFETEKLLLHLELPHTIVCEILDYAEYWVRAVDKAGNVDTATEPDPSYAPQAVFYWARVRIPESAKVHRSVRRIIFTIELSDIDSWLLPESISNSDIPSHIWLEVQARSKPTQRRLIVRDFTETPRRPAIHLVQWDGFRTDDDCADAELQEWLNSLRPGDELAICTTREASGGIFSSMGNVRIEIYCACV